MQPASADDTKAAVKDFKKALKSERWQDRRDAYLTVADFDTVARYAVMQVRWVRLEKRLASGRGLKIGSPEYTRAHRQAAQLAQELRRLSGQLGLTPESRQRLGAAMAPAGETPAEQRDRLRRIAGGKTPDQDKAKRFLGG